MRSVYRLIEFAMGIHGYPFTHEWMFYTFESLPMVPAIGVFLCGLQEHISFGREGRRVGMCGWRVVMGWVLELHPFQRPSSRQ